ncbi:uncharacterized protein PGTG_08384 [Puccinia graminis f. sp. tritici CRL 75-36-700-3]|uniref:Uncharacterized protein n=1 Tax=Puccinia graminis f. sp. tritici (strain CRL 75-36-700-3 / race SCCL) TaxID=418459 RepID=E3KDJ2_PUCGT|nr:uncharacterized protein PGTG_08384 [Puccinia graminis f. sp. tritici CRL 75-36-700-3]EFP82428.1 hypothetical protein PGTG_08384 [Puccinia graminis f. sp. tritici CRL 75-36-700-3]
MCDVRLMEIRARKGPPACSVRKAGNTHVDEREDERLETHGLVVCAVDHLGVTYNSPSNFGLLLLLLLAVSDCCELDPE